MDLHSARRRRVAVVGICVALLLAMTGSASASRYLKVGLIDDEQTLWSATPDVSFGKLEELKVRVLKVSLYWNRVAPTPPENPTDPGDPAYDWTEVDRMAIEAHQRGMTLLLTLLATPVWANSTTWRHAPDRMSDLRAFAAAAAQRYSGRYPGSDGQLLPRVSRWSVWNEPNLRGFLRPQWKRVDGRWVVASARTYARMCTAVWRGVHQAVGAGAKVACGETAPRGSDVPGRSVAPLTFLRGMKRAAARFDVFAHHPSSQRRSPTWRPSTDKMVTLGNIGLLIRELNRLYGKQMRLWVSEFSYRTNPPDPYLGVSWTQQARYLTEAYRLVREHRRIDLFIWFQLRDEARPGGWASGLEAADGTRKPAYWAFMNLSR